jgi:hypothetical protein
VAQVGESLPSKHKALSSNLSVAKKKKGKGKKKVEMVKIQQISRALWQQVDPVQDIERTGNSSPL